MKSNEKLVIVVLVAITICVIIFAVTRNKNNSNENNVVNNVVTQENGVEVQNLETPVDDTYVETSVDGTKVNTSEALKQSKVVNGIEFSDIQLVQQNGRTALTATIKNTNGTSTEMFGVDVTLLDDTGAEIITVNGLVSPLGAGETGRFETGMALDFSNAYDFRVTAK